MSGPGDVLNCPEWRGKERSVRMRQVMATMAQGQDSGGSVRSRASVAGRMKREGDSVLWESMRKAAAEGDGRDHGAPEAHSYMDGLSMTSEVAQVGGDT